ncbi:hypothetical protein Mapa_001095 [Marchantia paleacea]|nr:hypothetical protein Mapa_001095 [Marchantia paleacea]
MEFKPSNEGSKWRNARSLYSEADSTFTDKHSQRENDTSSRAKVGMKGNPMWITSMWPLSGKTISHSRTSMYIATPLSSWECS